MADFDITKSEDKDGTLIEIFFNEHKQGELRHSGDKVSLGTVQYINAGTGLITLRSAAPETEFSEHNIARLLCEYANNEGIDGMDRALTPEFFGFRSYDAMRKAEKYDNMTKDEIIEECLKLEDIVDSGYC